MTNKYKQKSPLFCGNRAKGRAEDKDTSFKRGSWTRALTIPDPSRKRKFPCSAFSGFLLFCTNSPRAHGSVFLNAKRRKGLEHVAAPPRTHRPRNPGELAEPLTALPWGSGALR